MIEYFIISVNDRICCGVFSKMVLDMVEQSSKNGGREKRKGRVGKISIGAHVTGVDTYRQVQREPTPAAGLSCRLNSGVQVTP